MAPECARWDMSGILALKVAQLNGRKEGWKCGAMNGRRDDRVWMKFRRDWPLIEAQP
jgi:hypothetical protein